jgi:uncharacterized SAM-binding protein YcdF (DUF218 family)
MEDDGTVAYKLLAAALMPINVILVLGAAALVLGGCLAPERPPRLSAELVESSDRLLHAARLYRAGKAPVVLASGGAVPWTSTSRPESEAMAAFLVEWGCPGQRSSSTRARAPRGRTPSRPSGS